MQFEQLTGLRNQLFQSTYDKNAHDSSIRDNNSLREHQKQLSTVLDNLRHQFDDYQKSVGISSDEAKKRDSFFQNIESVDSC